jgi:hypothetical protein
MDILAYKIDPNFRQDVADSYKRHYTDPREFVFSRSNDIALDMLLLLLMPIFYLVGLSGICKKL